MKQTLTYCDWCGERRELGTRELLIGAKMYDFCEHCYDKLMDGLANKGRDVSVPKDFKQRLVDYANERNAEPRMQHLKWCMCEHCTGPAQA